jgi:hypothetical protein
MLHQDFYFGKNVFLSMKNSKAVYSYFAMHFPAASEGSSGPYENLRLTALFAVVFLYRSTKSCEVL